ncbi:MAG: FAD-binding oxidoreductase [Planctomycetota bacterium]
MKPTSPPTISGWGRVPVAGRELRSEDLERLTEDAVLCRGLARSYGDASLPPPGRPVVVASPLADRILSFDRGTGVMRAEAGLSLRELNRLLLARGWFIPVSPGTQYVTMGGMVAADVHGKNHHQDGCFGEHVRALRMRVADGRILECSRERERDLFRATLGGMGLTGHILEVEFELVRVPSPWIWGESQRIDALDQFLDALKASAPSWPYSVGWIDCLSRGSHMGRGILMCGRFATRDEAPAAPPCWKRRLTLPVVLPEWALSRTGVRLFNALYYWRHAARVKRGIVHPETFFYPLDVVLEWNRMYGPRGFTQYQAVIPEAGGKPAVRRFFDLLTRQGGASFLCVIKDFAGEGTGVLSFPKRGTSIAMDIAVRDDTQGLVDALNALVIAEGGRVYLAKDGFTRAADYRQMEPRLAEFERIRRQWDPGHRVRSAMSVRLLGDQP